MATIFVTRRIPDAGVKLLTEHGHQVILGRADRALIHEELLDAVRAHQPEALLCLLTDRIDDAVFAAGSPHLRMVANYAAGFDNIDRAAAASRGVFVTNTPDVLTDAVAEYTLALILALVRRVCEADRYAKSGRYRGWDPLLLLGGTLQGKTLGVVGLGRIGRSVAERCARGLGMRIRYHSTKTDAAFEQQLGAQFRALDDLLAESDIISLHVPLTLDTYHLINAARLARIRPTAYLVNTARGPVVDESALINALERGHLAGAALDVFECEPSLACSVDDHLKLKVLPNVILTPHIASATTEARQAMSRVAAENILAVLEGRAPPNLVPIAP
ncbi:D-glycerate dehydrogenase [Candidatus Uhrbacteria bacterium]|nr:D-glycerate dehydrogenase [Candidatus Uhrbacteria bacterium]